MSQKNEMLLILVRLEKWFYLNLDQFIQDILRILTHLEFSYDLLIWFQIISV